MRDNIEINRRDLLSKTALGGGIGASALFSSGASASKNAIDTGELDVVSKEYTDQKAATRALLSRVDILSKLVEQGVPETKVLEVRNLDVLRDKEEYADSDSGIIVVGKKIKGAPTAEIQAKFDHEGRTVKLNSRPHVDEYFATIHEDDHVTLVDSEGVTGFSKTESSATTASGGCYVGDVCEWIGGNWMQGCYYHDLYCCTDGRCWTEQSNSIQCAAGPDGGENCYYDVNCCEENLCRYC